MTRKTYVLIVLIVLVCSAMVLSPRLLVAQELEMINRPVNAFGLTGLLYTTSPYTLPAGIVEVGASIITERAYVPEYTVTSFPLTVSYGLNDTTEMAIRAIYWKETQDQLTRLRGVGDTELSFKWNLLPQKEYSARPSIAVLVSGILPSGDREEGTNTVNHWGGRAGIAIGSEVPVEDYVLGIYGDVSVTVQDLSDETARDWYHTLDAGVLLPVSKYRNLQMFVEYNRQNGKDSVTLHSDDYSAFTYGLRVVNPWLNLTFGAQFIHKYVDSHDNASRVTGMISFKI